MQEIVLNSIKNKLFPIKNLDKIPTCRLTKATPELSIEATKRKKSNLKLQQKFINEIIADTKDINNEIFSVILIIRIHCFSKRLTCR